MTDIVIIITFIIIIGITIGGGIYLYNSNGLNCELSDCEPFENPDTYDTSMMIGAFAPIYPLLPHDIPLPPSHDIPLPNDIPPPPNDIPPPPNNISDDIMIGAFAPF